jgi:hypothetical protein
MAAIQISSAPLRLLRNRSNLPSGESTGSESAAMESISRLAEAGAPTGMA